MPAEEMGKRFKMGVRMMGKMMNLKGNGKGDRNREKMNEYRMRESEKGR
jgi:hypothetical protein